MENPPCQSAGNVRSHCLPWGLHRPRAVAAAADRRLCSHSPPLHPTVAHSHAKTPPAFPHRSQRLPAAPPCYPISKMLLHCTVHHKQGNVDRPCSISRHNVQIHKLLTELSSPTKVITIYCTVKLGFVPLKATSIMRQVLKAPLKKSSIKTKATVRSTCKSKGTGF